MSRPALFLDRDGTLNVEREYLHRPEDLELIPGSAAAIAKARAQGWAVVVITNQGGIGLGKYTWEDYERVTERLQELLGLEGAHLDGIYANAHHPRGQGEFAGDHPDRKPNPGMLLRAARELDLELSRSWMIGDKAIDLEAGRRAGCRTALVLTGYGREMDPSRANLVAETLAQAIEQVLSSS